MKFKVVYSGKSGNHHSTQGGITLSSEKWNPNGIRVSSTEETSLRDQFAMVALSGISSNMEMVQEAMKYAVALQDPSIPSPKDGKDDFQFHMMASWAYKQADAMMEARK